MKIRLSHTVTILLMLVMQSAVAVHELDHQSYEHTEQCRSFISADQAAVVIASSQVSLISAFDKHYSASTHRVVYFFNATAFSPRAPPNI